jgi:hypothetical protein
MDAHGFMLPNSDVVVTAGEFIGVGEGVPPCDCCELCGVEISMLGPALWSQYTIWQLDTVEHPTCIYHVCLPCTDGMLRSIANRWMEYIPMPLGAFKRYESQCSAFESLSSS